jgi:hypothetical protein
VQEFEQQRAAESDLRAKYYSGTDVTKNNAGWTCAMFGGEGRNTRCCGREHEGKRPLGRLRGRGRIILKWISKHKMGGHELD